MNAAQDKTTPSRDLSPVGVLAVMSAAIEDDGDWQPRMVAARAAVAELAATQHEMLKMLEAAYRQLGMWSNDNLRIQRARAALRPFPEAK